MTTPTLEDWLGITATAYLAYRRDAADWSPPQAASAKFKPHRGTEAARQEMYRNHRRRHGQKKQRSRA